MKEFDLKKKFAIFPVTLDNGEKIWHKEYYIFKKNIRYNSGWTRWVNWVFTKETIKDLEPTKIAYSRRMMEKVFLPLGEFQGTWVCGVMNIGLNQIKYSCSEEEALSIFRKEALNHFLVFLKDLERKILKEDILPDKVIDLNELGEPSQKYKYLYNRLLEIKNKNQ